MKKYPLLFAVCLTVYLLHFAAVRHGIYGDGNGYFAISHTLLFQQKLDFAPVYRHLSAFPGARYTFSRIFWDTAKTATGVLNCPWLIGTSLFWLPFMAVAAVAGTVLRLGLFHPAYEAACGIAGIALMLAGLRFMELTLKARGLKNKAAFSVMALATATQLFYYASFEPALSHQAAFFLVSLYMYIYTEKHGLGRSILLEGFILGLTAITRMGDVIILFPFAVYRLYSLARRQKFRKILLFVSSFAAALVPQLLFQHYMYGNAWTNTYIQGEKGSFGVITPVSLFLHLFAWNGGLFLYSPLLLFALYGLVKKKEYLSVGAFVLYLLFIASWEPFVPAGFGNRFFVAAIPLFAPGLAWLAVRYPKRASLFLMCCLLWNAALLTLFYANRP